MTMTLKKTGLPVGSPLVSCPVPHCRQEPITPAVGHLIEPANTDKWIRSVLSDPLSKVYRENDMTDLF